MRNALPLESRIPASAKRPRREGGNRESEDRCLYVIDRIRAGMFRGNPREFTAEARDCSGRGNNLENSSIHLYSGNSPAAPPRIFDAFASRRGNIFYGLSHLLRAADPEKSGECRFIRYVAQI